MSRRYEATFAGHLETEIFYQAWVPDQSLGTMIVTHGLAEHSECYDHFGKIMAKDGWTVLALDLRGHGRSEGKRGFVEDFDHFAKDLRLFITHVNDEFHKQNQPLVLFGHSLGGLITLKTCMDQDLPEVAAICLSAPALGLAVKVPLLKEKIAFLAADWLPGITLHNELSYEDLSRNEELVRRYAADPLRHDKISPRLFVGMLKNIEIVQSRAQEIQLPLLLQLPGNDRVISSPDSKTFFDKVGSKQKKMIEYNDSLHEIFNDLDKDVAFGDLREFLNPFKSIEPSKGKSLET